MSARMQARAVISKSFITALALFSAMPWSPPDAAASDVLDIDWAVGGFGGAVTGAKFSADGLLTATASGDGTVKLWDVSTGRLLRTFLPDIGGIFATSRVAFSPDGAQVAASGVGGAYVWNVADAQVVAQFGALESGFDVAFSPDGQWLVVVGSAAGSEESTLLFRRSDGGLEWATHNLGVLGALAVKFSNDSATIFTGTGNDLPTGGTAAGRIRYLRTSDGAVMATLSGHTDFIHDIDLSPDGTMLASASADDAIKLWDVAGESLIRTLSGHSADVMHVVFSPDGTKLASVGADGAVRIWNVADGSSVIDTPTNMMPLASIDWSPDGESLIVGGGSLFAFQDNTLQLRDADDATILQQFNENEVTHVGFDASADGSRLVTTDIFAGTQVRDSADGAAVRTIDPMTTQAVAAISPAGDLVVTGGMDGQLRIWRVSDGALIDTIPAHTSRVIAIDISPDGELLLSSSFTEPPVIRRLDTGAVVSTIAAFGGGVGLIRFMPDSQHVVAAGGFTATIFQVSDGMFVRFFSDHTDFVRGLAVSPDGEILAVSAGDRSIRLWDTSNGDLLLTLMGHGGMPDVLAFSSDGATLATAARFDSEALRFWSVATGEQLVGVLTDTGSGLTGLAFSPDDAFVRFGRRDASVISAQNPVVIPPGDIDGDGDVDDDDIAAFVAVLVGEPMAPGHALRSDLNDDAFADGRDVAGMVGALIAP